MASCKNPLNNLGINKTLPTRNRERNEKTFNTKRDEVVGIQPVVGVQVVAVQITTVVTIVPDIEHVGVPVGRNVCSVSYSTTPQILSGLERIRDHNHITEYTKYLYFLRV